jgi:heptosyltransferase-3
MNKILVYRFGQLGDGIISLPALHCLRSHYPAARFDLLSDHWPERKWVMARDLFGEGHFFHSFLSYRPGQLNEFIRLVPILRNEKYDAVAYLVPSLRSPGQRLRDRIFFQAAGIRKLLGWKGFRKGYDGHEADALLERLSADGLDVGSPGSGCMDLNLSVAEEKEAARWADEKIPADRKLLYAVGPFSKMPAKRWPQDRFIEVMERLFEEYRAWPLLFGGPEDRAEGDQFVSRMGFGSNVAGALGVRASGNLLKQCRFYVGNDTGTMHLAVTAGLSCVAIFSARDRKKKWYPYGQGHVILRSDVECAGCMLEVCRKEKMKCLTQISPQDVLETIREKRLP